MSKEIPQILEENRDEISSCKMESCKSRYGVSLWRSWEEHFRDDDDNVFNELVEECRELEQDENVISRQDISDMVNKFRNSGSICECRNIKKIFLAIMLWGYIDDNRGPGRTKEMLSVKHFNETVKGAYRYIADGKIESAYKILTNKKTKLPQCGPVFLTKYLYFIGEQCGVKPLILDSVIARRLKELCRQNIKKYSSVRKNGQIEIKASLEGYMEYITDMGAWAEQLKIEPWQIEYFLYYYYKKD